MPRTNRFNYPPVLCRAIDGEQAKYLAEDRGWITTTTLIAPPQIRILLRDHKDEIPRDYSDEMFAFKGSMTHLMLEEYGQINEHDLVEHRFVGTYQGKTVTGKPDRVEITSAPSNEVGMPTERLDVTMQDYKQTSVWAILDGPKKEWVEQMNVNAQLMRDDRGFGPKQLEIIAILRDWDPSKSSDFKYPDSDVVTLHIPLWTETACKQFINDRMYLHLEAEGGNVPNCTAEEQWREETKYAVKKKRESIRATKVYDGPAPAYEHSNSIGGYVEVRRGRAVRCQGTARLRRSYCAVCSVCPQIRKELS